MIALHRLDKQPIVVNSDLIEFIESIPDTIITLTSGNKFIVRETVAEVLQAVIDFRRSLFTEHPPEQQQHL
jgi:flagellar protein FlbD